MLPTTQVDVAVIGGGPSGLAAAVAARENGASRVVLIERLDEPGGILPQCIHNGFGLHVFKEELTGPEYASRFVARAVAARVEVWLRSMALSLNTSREMTVMGPQGLRRVSAKSVVLAMGCRERTGPNIALGGARPAGVFTAGTAQRLVNVEGYLPGREVVVVGSGDIGLIMARRMTLEGTRVKAVVELMPYPGGLARNIRQCLQDFNIPLLLAHATLGVEGRSRVTGVRVAPLGADGKPDLNRETLIDCDTVLLSVGLLPENELSRQAGVEIDSRTGGPVVSETLETSVPGVFACGNVLHVHDLVDYVTAEAQIAGGHAAANDGHSNGPVYNLTPGENARYVLPQQLTPEALSGRILLSARAQHPAGASVVRLGGRRIARLPVVRPSEMIRLTVKPEDLTAALESTKAGSATTLDVVEEQP